MLYITMTLKIGIVDIFTKLLSKQFVLKTKDNTIRY